MPEAEPGFDGRPRLLLLLLLLAGRACVVQQLYASGVRADTRQAWHQCTNSQLCACLAGSRAAQLSRLLLRQL